MKIFECYFFVEKEIYYEEKNFYYFLCDMVEVCERILDEFEVIGENWYIINGYILVKWIKGELLIKVNGMFFVIDGGFLKFY